MPDLTNHIAGRNVPPAGGAYLDNLDPATGELINRVPASTAADVEAAANAAQAAFAGWSALPSTERSRLLLKLADLIDANLDALARAESIDTGKPLSAARMVDIPRSAANFRYFATAILHTSSEMHDFDGGGIPGGLPALNYTLRKPRGVAGLISPWNLPLYLLTWKIAPALATGCTAVCKPSEVTPTTAAMLGDLAVQAGLPPGVLNIVHGTGPECGGAIVQHPGITTISFTGSTKVGQWIAAHAGPMLKRVSLELGGKNPYIVFADADVPKALETAVRSGFSNQGQICLCGSRLLVHRSIADEFIAGLSDRAQALQSGDPLEASTQQGALTSEPHFQKVAGLVQRARELGGRVHCGGQPVPAEKLPERCRGGFFYEPTVISGLDPKCTVEQEEIFGPVVTVQTFETEEEAIALANGTSYGLAATLFTQDVSRAHRVGAKLESGIVWVNCWMVRDLRTPFGGAKASGVGREGGLEAIRFFTEPKNMCLAL